MFSPNYCKRCDGPCVCWRNFDRIKPITDMIKPITDMIMPITHMNIPSTDMSKTSTDMSKTSTDMSKTSTDMSKTSTDMSKLSTDMIKTALEKKGAFTSSAFRTISKDPPKISVEARADGGADVTVRLTSMPFIPQYRDARSPERRELENAAREEIIRSFELPRDRVGDGDIKVDIREGSVRIMVRLTTSIVTISTSTIKALSSASKEMAGPIMAMGMGATGAVVGAAAGSFLGPVGIGVGAAVGLVGGGIFGKVLTW